MPRVVIYYNPEKIDRESDPTLITKLGNTIELTLRRLLSFQDALETVVTQFDIHVKWHPHGEHDTYSHDLEIGIFAAYHPLRSENKKKIIEGLKEALSSDLWYADISMEVWILLGDSAYAEVESTLKDHQALANS